MTEIPSTSDNPLSDSPSCEAPPSDAPSHDESLTLSLGSYEGPLDLLLGLARQKRVDLKHISMSALAEQYLDFVSRARRLHLAVKAEYLVMAAHLARMKARLLLPRDKDESEKAEQSAEALRDNLLWLERARETARLLRTLPRLGSQIFSCGAVQKTLPESVVAWELDANLFELLQSYVAIERRRDRHAKGLRIRSLRLYDLQDARSALKAQLDRQWRDLVDMIPATVFRQAEREENPTLFLKSVVSGFFSAALDLASKKSTPDTSQKTQSQKTQDKDSPKDLPKDSPKDSQNEFKAEPSAYAELYQPTPESPLQLRLLSLSQSCKAPRP